MFIHNLEKYAKNEEEFINSLFEHSGTCVGYYKRQPGRVILYNMGFELVKILSFTKDGLVSITV